MSIRRLFFNGLCVFCLTSAGALAAPVPVSDYLIDFNQLSSKVVQLPGGGSDRVDLTYLQSLVSTAASNAVTQEAFGFADLTTAEVGAATRSLGSGNVLDALNSKSALFDTVTFTDSATVSFNFKINGSLSSTDAQINNLLNAVATVSILDITGQAQWIAGVDGTAFPFCFAPGCSLYERTVESDMEATRILRENRALVSRIDNNFPSDGNEYDVNVDVAGTLDVEAGKTYGLTLSMGAIASGARVNAADFSSTAAFRFIDLDGTSFTSGSGALLTAVPLPGAFWLMLSALAGMAKAVAPRKPLSSKARAKA